MNLLIVSSVFSKYVLMNFWQFSLLMFLVLPNKAFFFNLISDIFSNDHFAFVFSPSFFNLLYLILGIMTYMWGVFPVLNKLIFFYYYYFIIQRQQKYFFQKIHLNILIFMWPSLSNKKSYFHKTIHDII